MKYAAHTDRLGTLDIHPEVVYEYAIRRVHSDLVGSHEIDLRLRFAKAHFSGNDHRVEHFVEGLARIPVTTPRVRNESSLDPRLAQRDHCMNHGRLGSSSLEQTFLEPRRIDWHVAPVGQLFGQPVIEILFRDLAGLHEMDLARFRAWSIEGRTQDVSQTFWSKADVLTESGKGFDDRRGENAPEVNDEAFLGSHYYPFLALINIRKATRSDAAAIAGVHIRSWQAAYRGHFPDEFLDTLDSQLARRKESWTLTLKMPPSARSAVWVAEDDGSLCGFAHVAPTRTDEGAEVGEVSSIYLEPEQWGKGIGRELFQSALDDLRRMGFKQAILWVLESNERARHFYEAAGWAHDGGTKIQNVWGIVCNEIRYVVDL